MPTSIASSGRLHESTHTVVRICAILPTRRDRPGHSVEHDHRSPEGRRQTMSTERFDTIVIGAGQAGLATGYHLTRCGQRFVILDAHDRVGDVWRERFDSLRLYSPARYDGLPGWGIPGPGLVLAREGRGRRLLRGVRASDSHCRSGPAPPSTACPVPATVTSSRPGRTDSRPTTSSSPPERGSPRSSRTSPSASTPGSGNCIRATTAIRPNCRTGRCWWSGAATPARTSRWKSPVRIAPRSAGPSAGRCRSTSRGASPTSRSRSCGSWPITF